MALCPVGVGGLSQLHSDDDDDDGLVILLEQREKEKSDLITNVTYGTLISEKVLLQHYVNPSLQNSTKSPTTRKRKQQLVLFHFEKIT